MPLHLAPLLLQMGAVMGAFFAGPFDEIAVILALGWWMRRTRHLNGFLVRPSRHIDQSESLPNGLTVLQASGALGADGVVNKHVLQQHLAGGGDEVESFLQSQQQQHTGGVKTEAKWKQKRTKKHVAVSVDFVDFCEFLSRHDPAKKQQSEDADLMTETDVSCDDEIYHDVMTVERPLLVKKNQ